MLWIDDFEFGGYNVGDKGFLVRTFRENTGTDVWTLEERPAHTNQSHEPRLWGWCGSTDNRSRHGEGLARVVRVAKNGRAALVRVERGSEEETKLLEELGYPGLE